MSLPRSLLTSFDPIDFVATRGDVIDGSEEVDAQRAGHGGSITLRGMGLKVKT